jgi:hypothetical protein
LRNGAIDRRGRHKSELWIRPPRFTPTSGHQVRQQVIVDLCQRCIGPDPLNETGDVHLKVGFFAVLANLNPVAVRSYVERH